MRLNMELFDENVPTDDKEKLSDAEEILVVGAASIAGDPEHRSGALAAFMTTTLNRLHELEERVTTLTEQANTKE